jgi:hypothetical protein
MCGYNVFHFYQNVGKVTKSCSLFAFAASPWQISIWTYCDLIPKQFHVAVIGISITHVYWEVDIPLGIHAIGVPPLSINHCFYYFHCSVLCQHMQIFEVVLSMDHLRVIVFDCMVASFSYCLMRQNDPFD